MSVAALTQTTYLLTEPFVRTGAYASPEQALKHIILDYLDHQIAWAEAKLRRYERKYRRTFAEWSASLTGVVAMPPLVSSIQRLVSAPNTSGRLEPTARPAVGVTCGATAPKRQSELTIQWLSDSSKLNSMLSTTPSRARKPSAVTSSDHSADM